MSVLVLMRHGQASFGADTYDALSDLGHAQARAAGDWLRERGVRPTRLWQGPRRRHAQTAQGLLGDGGLAVEAVTTPGLDEFGDGEDVLAAAEQWFGRAMTGANAPPRREQLRCYDEATARWAEGRLEIPGRSSFVDFRRQVRDWLDSVVGAEDAGTGRHELAVTSAGVVSAAVCEVLQLPDAQWHALLRVIHNASFTEIVFSAERRSLRSFNAVGHLPLPLVSSI
jgi:broad specificity phosphatase PhoE